MQDVRRRPIGRLCSRLGLALCASFAALSLSAPAESQNTNASQSKLDPMLIPYCCAVTQRVASNDTLNIRAEMDAQSRLLGRIPYDAKDIDIFNCVIDGNPIPAIRWVEIVTTGDNEAETWCQVQHQGKTGWVNASYLKPAPVGDVASDTPGRPLDDTKHGIIFDYASTFDRSVDFRSSDFVAFAATQDDWSRFDLWYLVDHKNAQGMNDLGALSGQRAIIGTSPILQRYVDVFEIASVADKHPDWTAEDISIELADRSVDKRERYAPWIDFVVGNRLPLAKLRGRVKELEAAISACKSSFADLRPSLRPTNDAAGTCARTILSRGKSSSAPQPVLASRPKLRPDFTMPAYPPLSSQANEKGSVTVAMCVDELGGTSNHTLVTSSGFPRLDEATLEAARGLRLIPAKYSDGQPAPFCNPPYKLTLDWTK